LNESIAKLEQYVAKERICEIFGAYNKNEFSLEELKDVSMIEIELLNAIGWNLPIDLPFQHINDVKVEFNEVLEAENMELFFNSVLRGLCLIMQSAEYLSIPPVVSAAVAVSLRIDQERLPASVKKWINDLREANPASFQKAVDLVSIDCDACVPIRQL
jgi:hypothetical protein